MNDRRPRRRAPIHRVGRMAEEHRRRSGVDRTEAEREPARTMHLAWFTGPPGGRSRNVCVRRPVCQVEWGTFTVGSQHVRRVCARRRGDWWTPVWRWLQPGTSAPSTRSSCELRRRGGYFEHDRASQARPQRQCPCTCCGSVWLQGVLRREFSDPYPL